MAERAGVSKSLVSLVLRDSPHVSEHRRTAVLEAIDALGYRPNAVARSLVTRRTRVFGVLVSDLHNPFFADVVEGIQEAAQEHGYQALLGSGNRRSLQEEQVIEAMLELRTEALLLVTPTVGPAILRVARDTVPVVVVGRQDIKVSRIDTVTSDEVAGTHAAVAHLVEHGHRRIGYIAGRVQSDDPRGKGYRRAMSAFGLDDHVLIAAGAYTTEEGGYSGAEELLSNDPRPTAILAVNDPAAIGALAAIEDRGLRVPEDISLVGYDNSQLASLRPLGLTSVHQPRFEMGQRAFAALLGRIDGGSQRAKHEVLPPTLVERSTVAAPPPEAG
ncbi:LacI family transcriptional regulator [Egibacter rhizosphaerae]|uniref:LacI family transcriptional regulator n=1 Tax=Egibacter rhizosphaerae TaxID=1670831 RepID=A0A411YLK9_9ACTN|nr:LacI family transcriptional regulator [Egibacter rhizosphaerae]